MANASSASKYSEITIDKDGKRVALEGKTVSFSYYESLLSPFVSANLVYVDTGFALNATSGALDTQGRKGTILSSLPIRGNEKLEFIIEGKLGSLDFKNYPLRVISATPPSQESFREGVILSLISESGLKNENSTIYKKYYNNIKNSVAQILQELEVPSNKIFSLDDTQNSYAFTGSSKKAFDLITALCPKSIPLNGSPGFFFFETQKGYHFKAIDNLISQNSVATYEYYNVAKSSYDDDKNDFRILSYNIQKNQNVLDSLKSGMYKTKNIFFNPYDFTYEEIYLSLDQSGIKNLGNLPEVPSDFISTNEKFSRTHTFILDSGNMEVGLSTSINNNPKEYQAKSVMRYNLMFAQVINMMVPCNPNLKAGDIIQCEFEKITADEKSLGSVDESISGKYLILHLCHSFDSKRSYTSLTLVRDTYGLYTSGGTI